MKPNLSLWRQRLLSFHLGSIEQTERLLVERRLLSDAEALLDYFELKRKMEDAVVLPSCPSPQLWARLQSPSRSPKKFFLPLSLGGALVASLLISSLFIFDMAND